MARVDLTLEKLGRAQERFLRLADAVGSGRWQEAPRTGCWSAAQVVAHLCQVERGVVGSADRIIQKTPLHFPVWKRLHFPLFLVEQRVIRRKSPFPEDPGLLAEKETMLAELRGVRERTRAFLEETRDRELGVYAWRHPFLGRLSFYEWFEFVAMHQNRHSKQMNEISQIFQKA